MADGTRIEWTDATWSPITGCSKASPGCKNCFAERIAKRLAGRYGYPAEHPFAVTLHPERLKEPLLWKRPRRIFVVSMGDLFHPDVPDEFIDQVFAVMAAGERHTFQVLTKRPDRMAAYCSDPGTPGRIAGHMTLSLALTGAATNASHLGEWAREGKVPWPLPNVWLGTSIEDQPTADRRVHELLKCQAAVRFVSAEPLLGPIQFRPYTLTERPCFVCEEEDALGLQRGEHSHPINCGWRKDQGTARGGVDWVIVGGESGPGARPLHPDWARSLRDQCRAAGVPFLFKQWGEWIVASHDNGHFGSDMARNNAYWVDMQGQMHKPSSLGLDNPIAMFRAGKKAAGRLLDGVLHDEYPEVRA